MSINDTTYKALTESKIAEALSFMDYDDREEWVAMAMCIKSELGEAGFDMWNDWSSNSNDYKIGAAKSVWRSAKPFGGRTVGTLIFLAQQLGFKISDDYQRISKEELKKREQRQAEVIQKAQQEQEKLEQVYATMAKISRQWWDSCTQVISHPYLDKKSLPSLNLRSGEWRFYLSNQTYRKTVPNTLLVPLYDENKNLVSLQGILPTKIKLTEDSTPTDKMYLRGARKSGTYSLLDGDTDIIYLVEGWATGATVHLATGKMVYVAMDSGNLPNVARIARKHFPYSRLIIAADNDQFKKSNSGIKQATKASIYNDCDIMYPLFKDLSTKPTDFDDLRMLEGIEETRRQLTPKHHVYKPVVSNVFFYDAWKLNFVADKQNNLIANLKSSDHKLAASSAMTLAIMLSKNIPVSMDYDQLKQFIYTDSINPKTITSIMSRVRFMVNNRHALAMTAIKPKNWKKHDYIAVNELKEISINDIDTPMVIVTAPTAAGKTKDIIKPFCDESKRQDQPFLATAPFISLISDLSNKLEISNYSKVNNCDSVDNMAICLPSIEVKKYRPFIDRVNALAIDEISQVLRFTSSKICNVKGADSEQIFYGLRKLMNECGRVVVADASIDEITLDSIEQARPEEKFTIIEKLPDRSRERKCFMYEKKGDLIQKIIKTVTMGQNVWVSVESATMAKALEQLFNMTFNNESLPKSMNRKIIALYSDAKSINKKFYDDVENESRKYNVVIASPTISSGVSVEHRDNPHFSLIAGFANGTCKQPTDFMQMLARVRYVNDYHVCMEQNSINNDLVTAESLLLGLRQAAEYEGGLYKENDYSKFMARIKIADECYKSDFAAGFYWIMQYYCFEIIYIQDLNDFNASDSEEFIKQIKKDQKEEFRRKVIAAKSITYEQAQAYKQADKNPEEVTAYFVRASLGYLPVEAINEQDLDMFENLASLDRFTRLRGLEPKQDDSEKNISLRKFSKAQIDGVRRIFNGDEQNIQEIIFNQEKCSEIVERISMDENRFYLASLGLIPKRYGQWIEAKGKVKPFNKPKDSVKAVGEILTKFGLDKKRTQKGSREERESGYVITTESYSRMMMYSDRRNARI